MLFCGPVSIILTDDYAMAVNQCNGYCNGSSSWRINQCSLNVIINGVYKLAAKIQIFSNNIQCGHGQLLAIYQPSIQCGVSISMAAVYYFKSCSQVTPDALSWSYLYVLSFYNVKWLWSSERNAMTEMSEVIWQSICRWHILDGYFQTRDETMILQSLIEAIILMTYCYYLDKWLPFSINYWLSNCWYLLCWLNWYYDD